VSILRYLSTFYAKHGLIAVGYRIFGNQYRFLNHGYPMEQMGFERMRNSDVFNFKTVIGGWNHVHPSQFRGTDKNIYFVSDLKRVPSELEDAIHLNSILELTKSEIELGVFYIYFKFDTDALPQVRYIMENRGILIPHIDGSKTSYRFVDKYCFNALQKTWGKKDRITHLNFGVHENICEALRITAGLQGDYLEIGVYKGGSMLTAINYLSECMDLDIPIRRAIGLDTFNGFDYQKAQQSSDQIWFSTHKLFGQELTKNYVDETLGNSLIEWKTYVLNICEDHIPADVKIVSVAYVDVDLYEATLDSLNKVHPILQNGGIIICEDPASTPALYGALFAMEEFLKSENGKSYTKIFKNSTYFLIKNIF
jgi:hypothetical protein